MQVNKSNKNYYLNDDPMIILLLMTLWQEIQHKQNFDVMMAGSGSGL
jgi:hypothetical protein